MATYTVWLKVKDSYGNTKEINGGTIDVDLTALTDNEISHIEDVLPLDDYLKKSEIDTHLDYYATDQEVADKKNLKYLGFFDDNSNGGTN